jgi:hypothetical protein
MNGQQIYALLGQWYDVVGQQHGGGRGGGGGMRTGPTLGPGTGPGMGPGHRHRDRDRFRGAQFGYPWYGYGFDQGGYDPSCWYYLQQLQALQQQQVPVPVPVPVPSAAPAPAMPPAAASGWVDLAGSAVGQWVDLVGQGPGAEFPFPARAAVVDAPLPTQANRDILPMSTGVPILPTQSAQITGRPQTLVFKIGRFVISNAGTAGGAADWIVNDIKIGNRSQFVQSGDVPGDLFATNAIDTFVRFEAAQTAMDVVVVVTYIGLNESGCPFFGAMVGTAAV